MIGIDNITRPVRSYFTPKLLVSKSRPRTRFAAKTVKADADLDNRADNDSDVEFQKVTHSSKRKQKTQLVVSPKKKQKR